MEGDAVEDLLILTVDLATIIVEMDEEEAISVSMAPIDPRRPMQVDGVVEEALDIHRNEDKDWVHRSDRRLQN